jgi:hypothetical protein
MLLKRAIAFGTSPQELNRRSDLLGLDIHTTILLPEAFSTILETDLVVTDGHPPADSELRLHHSSGL